MDGGDTRDAAGTRRGAARGGRAKTASSNGDVAAITLGAFGVLVLVILVGGNSAACRGLACSPASTSVRRTRGATRDASATVSESERDDPSLVPRPEPVLARSSSGAIRDRRESIRARRAPRTLAFTDDVAAVPSTGSSTSSGSDTCSGVGCPIHDCPRGVSTTLPGTVYDPAGKRPLYGVVVYVPSTTPDPMTSGAACVSCADLYSGEPIASAVTDPAGNFTISHVPDGTDIPLVIQIGKWRRQFVLPSVARCASTSVPDRTLTLPRNGREGDLPNIAISTGNGDSLECLLHRVGVDDAEYVAGAGGTGSGGHLHIFKASGVGPDLPVPDTSPPAPVASDALWGSTADLMPYDMVLLSCTGYLPAHVNRQALFDYAASGGRVFASHSHYVWFDTGPFGDGNLAAWTSGIHQGGTSFGASIVTTWADQPFARGQAFADWLLAVGALIGNELPIESPPSYNAYVTPANTRSQPWIVANNRSAATLDFSFDMPLGAPPADQCGRVAFADMHAWPGAGDYQGESGRMTPTGCGDRDLSPQEKALEFILFDLATCVTPGHAPEEPP